MTETLLLILVGFIAGIVNTIAGGGSLLTLPVLIFLVQAYYAGFGNMDYTLERYHDTRGSINYVRDHKGFAIGNGAVFLMLLAIPILGMLLAPFLGAVSSAEVIIRAKQAQVN